MYDYPKPPEYTPAPIDRVSRAVEEKLPDSEVVEIVDRGVWRRHIYEVTLKGGMTVFLKADVFEWAPLLKEAYIAQLLRSNRLPAPNTLAVDDKRRLLGRPFVIQAASGGTRLGDLVGQIDDQTGREIYTALGRFYRRLHAITKRRPGWICDGEGSIFAGSPTREHFEDVIIDNGRQAVESGLMPEHIYWRMVQLWNKNLKKMSAHAASLVTGGAFPWSVYLGQSGGQWEVRKIMGMNDLLYWDAAWDVASIKYPVFMPAPPSEWWEAFCVSYGKVLNEKRLLLYHLMQRLDAAMGMYLEPRMDENSAWTKDAWSAFDGIMDVIERR
ncbi:MAG: phosphotransferase [Anaerolineae bacterium]|nr:phosphotransferase [Anaerolineae bacterium]